jgi:uncharacterized protein involved in exopolysaccharide biosynthesis/MinD-like ATPase involved in chromosome partitioning or flagellar assembly
MAKLHIRRTIIFIIIGIVCGLLYTIFTPKVYEGTVQLVISNPNAGPRGASTFTPDVQDVLETGKPRNPITELGILRGRGLFFAALEETSRKVNKPEMVQAFERYYSMYDVLGEKDSDAALIQARAFTPEDAAELANTIAAKYNEQRVAGVRESAGRTVDYLQQQLDVSEKNLDRAIAERRAYKEKHVIGDLTADVGQAEAYRTTALTDLDRTRAAVATVEIELATTKATLDRLPTRQNAEEVTVKNPVVTKLESDLTDLQARKVALLARYHPDHPDIRQLDDTIKGVRAELQNALKREMQTNSQVNRVDPTRQQLEYSYRQALIRRDAVRQQLAEQEAIFNKNEQKIQGLTAAEEALAKLDREAIILDSHVRTLKIQLENLKNRTHIGNQVAQVVFPARISEEVVFPDPLLVGFISIFGGAALGLLYSFAVESLRLRIYTSYQLADLTGLPVVASVPKLPGPTQRQIATSLSTGAPRILESIRLLAFSLVAQPHEGCRKLLFTGLDRHTGTSSSASQLALALGHTGARVILVDSDLMGRSVSRMFNADNQKGLAEALMSSDSVESIGELLRESSSPNVKILPAGMSNDRALKEAETRRLEEALNWLSTKCDYLVFDCPPCLRNSEAARLASEADEVYLVVSLRLSTVPVVSAALDILRQAGADVVRLLTTEGDRSEEALAREARVAGSSKALPS